MGDCIGRGLYCGVHKGVYEGGYMRRVYMVECIRKGVAWQSV